MVMILITLIMSLLACDFSSDKTFTILGINTVSLLNIMLDEYNDLVQSCCCARQCLSMINFLN